MASLFGGWGQKKHHFKHAIQVYEQRGYTCVFYESGNLASVQYKSIEASIKKALEQDTCGSVIHASSAGNWTAFGYASKVSKNKLYVCEAGPLKTDIPTLVQSIENAYNSKVPHFVEKRIPLMCMLLGIPYGVSHPWFTEFDMQTRSVRPKHFEYTRIKRYPS